MSAVQEHAQSKWISLAAAAEFLSVSYQYVWGLVRSGKLEAYRCGPRTWRTTRDACERFLGVSTTGAGSEPEADMAVPDDYEPAMRELEQLGVLPKGGHQGWQRNKKSRGRS